MGGCLLIDDACSLFSLKIPYLYKMMNVTFKNVTWNNSTLPLPSWRVHDEVDDE